MKKSMTTAVIESADLTLPLDDTKLLTQFLFVDGWFDLAELKRLYPLWNPNAAAEEIKVARELFTKKWIESNAAFNLVANEFAKVLGRPLTEDERMKIEFPHGDHYAEAQKILSDWFTDEMKSAGSFLN